MQYNKGRQHELITRMKKEELKAYVYELIQVADGLVGYMEAIPDDTILPAMPGVDRDWVDNVLQNCYYEKPKYEGFEL